MWQEGLEVSIEPKSSDVIEGRPQTTPTHAVYVKADAQQNFKTHEILSIILNRGADKSLARPARKQANLSVIKAWISFGALPCKKKIDDSSRLDVVEIARVPDMLPSFVSFLVGLRTYQHPGIPYTYFLFKWRSNGLL